jgi:hypothetical protein
VLDVGWELVKWHLEGMFGSVVEGEDKEGCPVLRVSCPLTLSHGKMASGQMTANGFSSLRSSFVSTGHDCFGLKAHCRT